MARTPKKDDDGKKISGINKFLYRGYEVYDAESKTTGECETLHTNSQKSIQTSQPEFTDGMVTGRVSASDAPVSEGVKQIISDGVDKKQEPVKYRKRAIRDSKVWENLNNIADPVIRGGLSSPMFDGNVNQQLTEIKLSTSRGTVTKRYLISEIVSMQQHIKINNDSSYVKYEDENGSKTVPTHRDLVAFLKVLVMCQYNASHEFSQIVSGFVCEVFLEVVSNDFHTPISVQTSSKLQEVILKELNEYYADLLKSCNINATEVITEQSKKTKKGSKQKKSQTIIEDLIDSAAVAKEV